MTDPKDRTATATTLGKSGAGGGGQGGGGAMRAPKLQPSPQLLLLRGPSVCTRLCKTTTMS